MRAQQLLDLIDPVLERLERFLPLAGQQRSEVVPRLALLRDRGREITVRRPMQHPVSVLEHGVERHLLMI